MAPSTTPNLLSSDDPDVRKFAREFEREIRGQLPEEKNQALMRQLSLARIMRQAGSLKINGVGQLKARIDTRLFMRWHLQYPGCWWDKDFVDRMLRDNPAMCAPGYKPKPAPKFI